MTTKGSVPYSVNSGTRALQFHVFSITTPMKSTRVTVQCFCVSCLFKFLCLCFLFDHDNDRVAWYLLQWDICVLWSALLSTRYVLFLSCQQLACNRTSEGQKGSSWMFKVLFMARRWLAVSAAQHDEKRQRRWWRSKWGWDRWGEGTSNGPAEQGEAFPSLPLGPFDLELFLLQRQEDQQVEHQPASNISHAEGYARSVIALSGWGGVTVRLWREYICTNPKFSHHLRLTVLSRPM